MIDFDARFMREQSAKVNDDYDYELHPQGGGGGAFTNIHYPNSGVRCGAKIQDLPHYEVTA